MADGYYSNDTGDFYQREPSPKRQRTPNGYVHSPDYRSAQDYIAHREQDGARYQLASRPANARDYDHSEAREDLSAGVGHSFSRHPYRRDSRSRSTSSALQAADDTTPYSAGTPAPQKPTRLHYKPKLVLRGHKKGVSQVKYSPDGRWIASCSADATIKIWDAFTGKHQHTLEGHLAGISTIAWSPDSKVLASGSDDKSIRLWDTSTGKPHPNPLLGHHNYIYSLAFSPKGNMLVSGSYDEAVFIWDVRTARVMKSLPAHSDPVSGVDFVRDGTLVVSCASDGLIRIWDTATGQCLRTLVHSDNFPVTSVRFSPNGKFVLAWTLDSCIRLWNYVEGRCVKTYQGHKNEKYSLGGAFGVYFNENENEEDGDGNVGRNGEEEQGGEVDREARGGKRRLGESEGEREREKYAFIVSGSEDGALVFWDVGSKNVLQRLEGHDLVVLGADTHPMERMVVSCGLDKTVRVWEFDRNMTTHNGEVTD